MPAVLHPDVVAAITGLGKTVLALAAGTFILWALWTAMRSPKRDPEFPRNLNLYILVTALLFVAQMAAVVWVTGTQEVEEEVAGHVEETTPPAGPTGDATAGKAVFEANCGSCHTLADAGASGSVGPNLDEAKPAIELVVDRVTNGQGAMPAFGASLEEQQIADVAAYVSSVAGA